MQRSLQPAQALMLRIVARMKHQIAFCDLVHSARGLQYPRAARSARNGSGSFEPAQLIKFDPQFGAKKSELCASAAAPKHSQANATVAATRAGIDAANRSPDEAPNRFLRFGAFCAGLAVPACREIGAQRQRFLRTRTADKVRSPVRREEIGTLCKCGCAEA